ncbi:MAG: hypothetical protein PHT33_09670 [bacterium]|nr:hypothetical protein [bacterium]
MYALFKRAFLFISILLVLLSGQASAERLITPGEQLEVTVWSDKDLSRTVTSAIVLIDVFQCAC